MGLHLMGVLRFTIPTPLKSQPKLTGLGGAFGMGLLFGVVSAPCAAPIRPSDGGCCCCSEPVQTGNGRRSSWCAGS
jgi:hypothetical protein